MNLPNLPTGSAPAAHWFRRMWDFVRANRLLAGPNYRLRRLPDGVVIDFDQKGGGGSSVVVQQYLLMAVGGDWLRCRTFDMYGYFSDLNNGSNYIGTTDVYVAKPPGLSETNRGAAPYFYDFVAGQKIGVNFTYSNSNWVGNRIREAFYDTINGTISENQMVDPPWAPWDGVFPDVLFAVKVTPDTGVVSPIQAPGGGSPTRIVWQDLNVKGRAWGKVFNPPQ